MIIGVDHLAMNVDDISPVHRFMLENDYQLLFQEKELQNCPSKKPLLELYQPVHDAYFYQHVNGFKIEVTDYKNSSSICRGFYSIDIENPRFISIDIPFSEQEKEFWLNGLGLKPIEEQLYRFKSPIKNWQCEFRFLDSDLKKDVFLDSNGFTCLAFICTSLREDMGFLRAHGANNIVGPIKLVMNSNTLEIMMFRSPQGALCELIQLDKG